MAMKQRSAAVRGLFHIAMTSDLEATEAPLLDLVVRSYDYGKILGHLIGRCNIANL